MGVFSSDYPMGPHGNEGGINPTKASSPYEESVQAPSYYEESVQAPSYYETPVAGIDYEEPPCNINLGKADVETYHHSGAIELGKTNEETFSTIDVAPPKYRDQEVEPHQGVTMVPDTAPRANNPNPVNSNNATVFHLVSIMFVLLSLVFSPLLAVVPVVLFCFMQQDLRQNNNTGLHVIDVTLAIVVTVLWFAFIIVLAVFTFGIGLVLLILLIPLFILCGQLASLPAGPRATMV